MKLNRFTLILSAMPSPHNLRSVRRPEFLHLTEIFTGNGFNISFGQAIGLTQPVKVLQGFLFATAFHDIGKGFPA
ncbi:MAG: hypothetical protein RIC36_05110 [Rhodospirillales bacterium]